jgi:hypothetical protein
MNTEHELLVMIAIPFAFVFFIVFAVIATLMAARIDVCDLLCDIEMEHEA